MVINAEIANVGKPNLCDWPRLWSASSLIGHVFKCNLDKKRVDNWWCWQWWWMKANWRQCWTWKCYWFMYGYETLGSGTNVCFTAWNISGEFSSNFQDLRFFPNNICICAKQYLHLCKTRFAFATHLWTCPLEHVVRSSSLVVGSGQAAMFKNHFCNSIVWICF